ncbi:MAG: ABC transporter permease [Hyphomicrobiales bacterium]|nr:MAG: ABC transporter permease [Hyphomicrobiales bacterium]
MAFLACLTVGGVSVVRDAARDWQNDISREVTIQIRPIDGIDIVREIDKAIAIAQEFSGVGTVRAISDDETRGLLEPWLGAGLDLEALPVPRLILVEMLDPAGVDLDGLRAQLKADVRGASLDDHSAWTRRLVAMARTMVFGGFLILVLVLTAMMLSVVFATRAAMAGNKEIIQVLHLVGAEDSFVAREFQRHFLLLGLKGGAAGGIAAIIVFALISLLRSDGGDLAASDQLRALFGQFTVGAGGYFGALGIVFLVAVLTAVTSRLAVRRTLQQME